MSQSRFLSASGETERMAEKRIDIPIVDNIELRARLISRIEDVTLNVIRQISSGQLPSISYSTSSNYNLIESQINEDLECAKNIEPSNHHFDDSSLKTDQMEKKKERNIRKSVIDFASDKGKSKLALMMSVMATAHRLLITNTTITRRSFYYGLKDGQSGCLVSDQKQVDQAVNNVANLLNCAPWELNLVATSKGLAAGDLTLSLVNNRIIDCTVPGGALIPQIVSSVISIRTRAKLVLIVEKDAVFQKLLEDNCTSYLNCILVTGKGYPDVATRMLVKLLSEKLELPVYILVDGDPYGVDIMCVYRFGSAALSKENESLACPNVRWLGILPSELIGLGVRTTPLTEYDVSKLAAIEGRPYMTEEFLKELKIMRKGKAEIEGIFSKKFLAATYLSCKIKGGDCI